VRDARARRRPAPAARGRSGDRGPAGRRQQRHPLLHGEPGRRERGGRLQAGTRRAPAVGLPRRHAGRSGGVGVPGERGDRLGRRPAHRAARRAVRSGHVPAVGARRRDGRPGGARPQRPPRPPPDGGLRRRRQQRRPQGGPPAAPCGRAGAGRRPRHLLLRRGQAAHAAVAVAGQAPHGGGGGGALVAARRARGPAGSGAARAADRDRGAGDRGAGRPAPQHPAAPAPQRGLAGDPLAAVL
ncbi:MAG: FIG00820755: hypothetical protein, partial [uncultured Frankineae bacterium]